MNKNILVIGAIILFIGMALIPAATANIKVSQGESQWYIAMIRGPFLGTSGMLVDAEINYASSFKIGNNYFYKDVNIVGNVIYSVQRLSSLYIGRYFSDEITPNKQVSINVASLINLGYPLEVANDGELNIHAIGFNIIVNYLE